MLEIIIAILCVGLCFKALKLALKLTGGVIRVVMALASVALVPVALVVSLLVGGLAILLPLAGVVGIVWLCARVLD